MMPSLMMMTSTRAGVTTIRLSIDKGKIFLSLTFFHHFLILYILYCLQLQCYKNSVCLVLCLALQLQLIEFSKGGAAMHDSVVLDLCTCWDRIFQHFSNISQSCVEHSRNFKGSQIIIYSYPARSPVYHFALCRFSHCLSVCR